MRRWRNTQMRSLLATDSFIRRRKLLQYVERHGMTNLHKTVFWHKI